MQKRDLEFDTQYTDEIAVIVTLVIFLITMIASNINAAADRKKRWYMDVLVNPNLPQFKEFFSSFLDEFKKEKRKIDGFNNKKSPAYTIANATAKRNLKNIVSKFLFEITPAYRSYDSELAESIRNVIFEFQDACTKLIDKEDINNRQTTRELEEIKKKFYLTIYGPLRENWYERISSERVVLWLFLIMFLIIIIANFL